jgi:hypothetical protein
MNWFLVSSIGAGILFLLVFKESYKRTDLDISIEVPAEPENKEEHTTDECANKNLISNVNDQNQMQLKIDINC